MRTSALLRDMPGISQKVLTQQLRELERDGIVVRRDFGKLPPGVEYGLTKAGHDLMPILLPVREYSRDHHRALGR